MSEQPVAIIPARGGSKRLPGKNIAELQGKPLLAYALESAQESGVFEEVIVSSDDEEILEVAREYGADRALERPAELATDTAQVKEVCEYHLEQMGYELFGLLLTTNPLRTADHVREAYETFESEVGAGLVSLVPCSHPPQRALAINSGNQVEPFFGYEYRERTQELENAYRHDGSIIFLETKAFLDSGELIPEDYRLVPYVIPEDQSVDIDEELHLKWAEFLLNERDD